MNVRDYMLGVYAAALLVSVAWILTGHDWRELVALIHVSGINCRLFRHGG